MEAVGRFSLFMDAGYDLGIGSLAFNLCVGGYEHATFLIFSFDQLWNSKSVRDCELEFRPLCKI
jgi:hypothetical protein